MADFGTNGARSMQARAVDAASGETLFFPSSAAIPAQVEAESLGGAEVQTLELPRIANAVRAIAPKSKDTLRVRLYAGLVLLDVLGIFVGFIIANGVRFEDPFAARGLSYSAAIIPPFLALALANGAYSLEALERPASGTWKSLRALSVAVVALLIAWFLSKSSATVSRLTFAVGTTIAMAAIFVSRRAYGRFAGELTNWNFVNELLLIDGLPIPPTGGRRVLLAQEHGISARANDPRTLERLGRLLEGYDRVLVAATKEDRLAWREMLKGSGIDIEILTPELDQLGATTVRRSEFGAALLVAPGPLRIQERIVKRSFDLLVGTTFLVIVAPLMLVTAIAIKLTSPGPVLFCQQRLGRANRQFQMLKFRTMYAERCDVDGKCSATPDDDRMTPLGRFLRRTSMDELPQLINVLKGEMSLVGPRPHAIASRAADSLFWNIDDRYWHRAAVKPGITGLAQVRGYRGATITTNDVMNRVDSDLEYLSRWSIWRDIQILIRTTKVLIHQNAF